MRKKDLKGVRKGNRRLIMRLLAGHTSLSRTEISEETGLSPSTVSGITAELVAQGCIHETGDKISTAGRGRTLLSINPHFGTVAVIDLSSREIYIRYYDMQLGFLGEDSYEKSAYPLNNGESLLATIEYALSARFTGSKASLPPLQGLGILHDDDTLPSELTVLYTTGFSQASITLKEALITRFRVPVFEESVNACSAQEIVEQHVENAHSWAHINIGKHVKVSLSGSGELLRSGEHTWMDMTPALLGDYSTADAFPSELDNFLGEITALSTFVLSDFDFYDLTDFTRLLHSGEQHNQGEKRAGDDSEDSNIATLIFLTRLVDMTATLCGLLPLDAVLLSGEINKVEECAHILSHLLTQRLRKSAPLIIPFEKPGNSLTDRVAHSVRFAVLTE